MVTRDPMRGYDPRAEDELSSSYLQFCNDPDLDVSGFLAGSGDPDGAHEVLETLEARGLIELPGDGRIEVPPPDSALPAYAAGIEHHARRVRASASELAMIHRQARLQDISGPASDTRRLHSLAEIRAASQELLASAERSIDWAWADSPRTRAALAPDADHDSLVVGSVGKAITTRAVYDAALLDSPEITEVLRRRQRAGEEVRIAHDVPYTALVVDERYSLLDFSAIEPTGLGSAVMDGRILVISTLRYIRHLHGAGLPTPFGAERTGGVLDERDLVVLTLLATGSSDAATARQLGISVRTVERRVRHIMSYLGTTSRLQTGIEASRRGLV